MDMLKKLLHLLQRYPMKSIFITVILIIVLAIGIKNIFMATGNDTLVKKNTDVYQDNLMLEEEFGGESVIVLYESEHILTPQNLAHMKGLEDVLQGSDSIYSMLSPVILVEEIANKQGKIFQEGVTQIIENLDVMGPKLVSIGTEMGDKLQMIGQNMETIYGYSDMLTPGIPTKQATLDHIIYDDGELRPMFKEVVKDDKYMLMMIRFNGHTTDDEKSKVVQTIHEYLDTEKIETAEILVSGKPVLDNAIRSSMQESIQKMMGLALLIMVIVLYVVFKVRWRLLPLFIVLVAVIGTIGLMGWLSIPITMVSMAVFPILIGLGIDYAIQFQNRYAEEMAKEDSYE